MTGSDLVTWDDPSELLKLAGREIAMAHGDGWHNWQVVSVKDGRVVWRCWCGRRTAKQVRAYGVLPAHLLFIRKEELFMDVSIPKGKCPDCLEQIVIITEDNLSRHRQPAPRNKGQLIIKDKRMVLGAWCKGSGKKPCGS